MDTSEVFSINEVGSASGRTYSGQFTVKTLLTRSDQFAADRKRREILGPNPQDALDGLKLEAFMIAQLSVRILKGPKVWEDTNGFLECEDYNVINTVFEKCIELERQRSESLKKESEDALKSLVKKESKKDKE